MQEAAAVQKDWDSTHATLVNEKKLGEESSDDEEDGGSPLLLGRGNPVWKYVLGAIVIACIGGWQLISSKGVNVGRVVQSWWSAAGEHTSRGGAKQAYVQLPDMLGKVGLRRKERGDERVIVVENASNRIVMVNIEESSSKTHASRDTASADVGYQS